MSTATKTSSGPWSSTAIDAASHGAIAFTQIYYETYDEPNRRVADIPKLFLPSAKIIWNGTPVPAQPEALGAFLDKVPLSRHDVQSLDCHPVTSLSPDVSGGNASPDLVITVTGSVWHGPTVVVPHPAGTQAAVDPTKVPAQDRPRKFFEMFVLRVTQQEGAQPVYAIVTANFRFIG